ncbi:DUF3892 domain-containing protein [Nocardia sp. NPDC052112]|uniref:DUF3892 domain-containing protein n=1 Tax=Nocardia sp. NPDC052112 TaxID=3155646 RepID=UPI00343D6987
MRWVLQSSGKVDQSSRQSIVSWIEEGGKAFVEEPGAPRVEVRVVDPGAGRAMYLQTYADGVKTNNLLHLPHD